MHHQCFLRTNCSSEQRSHHRRHQQPNNHKKQRVRQFHWNSRIILMLAKGAGFPMDVSDSKRSLEPLAISHKFYKTVSSFLKSTSNYSTHLFFCLRTLTVKKAVLVAAPSDTLVSFGKLVNFGLLSFSSPTVT